MIRPQPVTYDHKKYATASQVEPWMNGGVAQGAQQDSDHSKGE